jgi:hypothetical protein
VQLHIGESRDSGLDASHRPGMTVELRFLPPAGDRALFRQFRSLDARLDETIQNLNNHAALLFDDGRDGPAPDWRRYLLKRKDRHCVSPRR